MTETKRRKRSAPVEQALSVNAPSKSPKLSPAMKPSTEPSAHQSNEQSVHQSAQHLVHRCRFVPYKPSGIVALSINQSNNQLAVGRMNGNIEIWSINHLSNQSSTQTISKKEWYCMKTIPGFGEQFINQLLWLGERLFSVGLNGSLVEWSVDTLSARSIVQSNGGPIWNAAAKQGYSIYKQLNQSSSQSNEQSMDDDEDDQSASKSSTQSSDDATIVLSCEDGTLRLFDCSDDQAPVYVKSLIGHKERVLCCAFMDDPSNKQTNGTVNQLVVSGGVDESVRVWDLMTGRNIQRISVGHNVWTVCVTQSSQPSNQSIVVGDSNGTVSWFDTRFGTLKQSMNSHRADVQSIKQSTDHALYSVGLDGLMCEYRLVEHSADSADGKWVLSATHRAHTHDVLALAIQSLQQSASQPISQSIIVTGGVDTQLIITHRAINPSTHQSTSKFRSTKILPITQSVVSANPSHFLVHQQRTLSLYKLGSADLAAEQPIDQSSEQSNEQQPTPTPSHPTLPLISDYEHLVDFQLSRDDISDKQSNDQWDSVDCLNIVSSAISADSRWIASTDCMAVRLFEMGYAASGQVESVRKQPIVQSNNQPIKGCNVLAFSPKSDWLIAGLNAGPVLVIDPVSRAIKHSIKLEREQKGVWRTIKFHTQSNGQLFAIGDEHNNIFVIRLAGGSADWSLVSKLPVLTSPYTSFGFHHSANQSTYLMVTTCENSFHIFDALTGRLVESLAECSADVTCGLRTRTERVQTITSDPHSDKVLLTSTQYMCVVSTSLSSTQSSTQKHLKHSKKQIKTKSQTDEQFNKQSYHHMVNKYRPLLWGGFLSESTAPPSKKSKKHSTKASELLVVEAPWLNVLESLPAPLARKKYGT